MLLLLSPGALIMITFGFDKPLILIIINPVLLLLFSHIRYKPVFGIWYCLILLLFLSLASLSPLPLAQVYLNEPIIVLSPAAPQPRTRTWTRTFLRIISLQAKWDGVELLLEKLLLKVWRLLIKVVRLSPEKLARVVNLVVVLIVFLCLKGLRRLPASCLSLCSLLLLLRRRRGWSPGMLRG